MPNTKYTKLPRGLVVISGSDSNTFLQGLISQNVNKVTQKKAAYSALLTPQGKFLHDFCISKIGNNLILDCEQGREEELISNISKFKLRAKVELKHEKELSVFSVFGDEASQSLHLSNILGASREIKNGIASIPLEQQEYQAGLCRIAFEALEIHLAAEPQDSNKLLDGIDFMPRIEELVEISLSDSAAKLKAIRWGRNFKGIDITLEDLEVGFNGIPDSDEAICMIADCVKSLDAADMLNSYSIFSVRIPQENLIAKRRA